MATQGQEELFSDLPDGLFTKSPIPEDEIQSGRTPRWLEHHPDAPLSDDLLAWYTNRPSLLAVDYEQPRTIPPDIAVTSQLLCNILGPISHAELMQLFTVFVHILCRKSHLVDLDLAQNPIHNRIFCTEITNRIANDPAVIDGAGFWQKILLARLSRRTEVEWAFYRLARLARNWVADERDKQLQLEAVSEEADSATEESEDLTPTPITKYQQKRQKR